MIKIRWTGFFKEKSWRIFFWLRKSDFHRVHFKTLSTYHSKWTARHLSSFLALFLYNLGGKASQRFSTPIWPSSRSPSSTSSAVQMPFSISSFFLSPSSLSVHDENWRFCRRRTFKRASSWFFVSSLLAVPLFGMLCEFSKLRLKDQRRRSLNTLNNDGEEDQGWNRGQSRVKNPKVERERPWSSIKALNRD